MLLAGRETRFFEAELLGDGGFSSTVSDALPVGSAGEDRRPPPLRVPRSRCPARRPRLARPPRRDGAWSDGELVRLSDGTAVLMRSIDLGAARAVPEDDVAGIAAEDLAGHTVGWATYARAYGPRAEVALTVDPQFWHRGLPEVLLARLSERASRVGISTFFIVAAGIDLSLARPAADRLLRPRDDRGRVGARRVRDDAPIEHLTSSAVHGRPRPACVVRADGMRWSERMAAAARPRVRSD